ncbi:mechanosensitive ion channel family protein, partial [Sinorhizobium meliloti]
MPPSRNEKALVGRGWPHRGEPMERRDKEQENLSRLEQAAQQTA